MELDTLRQKSFRTEGLRRKPKKVAIYKKKEDSNTGGRRRLLRRYWKKKLREMEFFSQKFRVDYEELEQRWQEKSNN